MHASKHFLAFDPSALVHDVMTNLDSVASSSLLFLPVIFVSACFILCACNVYVLWRTGRREHCQANWYPSIRHLHTPAMGVHARRGDRNRAVLRTQKSHTGQSRSLTELPFVEQEKPSEPILAPSASSCNSQAEYIIALEMFSFSSL